MTPELQNLLRETSRSFYLTLRILPAAVRPQIGLAYLLARATDTVADTELLPVSERLTALNALRQRIAGTRSEPVDFRALVAAQPHDGPPAERELLRQVERALGLLSTLSAEDLQDTRKVLDTITRGQELDLQRFGQASAAEPRALAADAELDDYTYRVAGCVGEFWTQLTRRHVFPQAKLDDARFLAEGIRFGQGLQLVNILRDLPRDLRNGRCYFPKPALTQLGLQPSDLLQTQNEARFRPLYDVWVRRAEGALAAGWNYTNTIPSGQLRLRLACAWPILIGARTLAKLRVQPVLDGQRRIKISRSDVRAVCLGSLLRLPFRGAWEGQFSTALGRTLTSPG